MPKTRARKMPPERDVLREGLADAAHQAWIKWMAPLASKVGSADTRGISGETFHTGMLPEALVDLWRRQMATPYSELSPKEQKSGLHQADLYIHVMLYAIHKLGLRAVLLRLSDAAKKAGDSELARTLCDAREKIK